MYQHSRRLRSALAELDGKPCAMDTRRQKALGVIVADIVAGGEVSDGRVRNMLATSSERPGMSPRVVPGGADGKAVAIVTAHGIALYQLEWQPLAFSTRKLAATMTELANDPTIGTILLHVNSPGGSVVGTKEAADAVYAARQRKRVIALVDPLAASAAYYIAAQATEIACLPSGEVGSIGVYMMHLDLSERLRMDGVKPTFIFAGKHKVDGNPFEPLSAEARAFEQGEVDKLYREFVAAVARGRGVTAAVVNASFGQGRCYGAKDALAAGMIDRIETPDQALRSAMRSAPRKALSARRERVQALAAEPPLSEAAARRAAVRARLDRERQADRELEQRLSARNRE